MPKIEKRHGEIIIVYTKEEYEERCAYVHELEKTLLKIEKEKRK